MGSAIALSFPRHYFVKRQGESRLEIKLSEGMPASRRMRSRIVENRFGSPIRTLQVLGSALFRCALSIRFRVLRLHSS